MTIYTTSAFGQYYILIPKNSIPFIGYPVKKIYFYSSFKIHNKTFTLQDKNANTIILCREKCIMTCTTGNVDVRKGEVHEH